MSKAASEDALQRIRSNIMRHGHHVYLVSGGDPLPRYAYTIGLSERVGAELTLAGAFSSGKDIVRIVNKITGLLDANITEFTIEALGRFTLRKNLDPSWTTELMLGARDFHGAGLVDAWQIAPEPLQWTLDVPDMHKPWSADEEPVWQWMHVPWGFQVPSQSTAVTNLAALRGDRVTEAARWEDEEWELFAGSGPDVVEDQIRIVPLGTLLGADSSLSGVTSLQVGGGLWSSALKTPPVYNVSSVSCHIFLCSQKLSICFPKVPDATAWP